MAKKPALGKGLDLIFDQINENEKGKIKVPRGLEKFYGVKQNVIDSSINNEKQLINKANTMINNAKQGILVNTNGEFIKDFSIDMIRMQRVFDDVEMKRIEALVSGRGKGIDVRISSQDIKAVMFKPIIRMNLENPNVIEGRTQFKRLWNFTKTSLYDDLSNLTEEKLQKSFQDVYDNISSFERYVLSTLSDNPKEWDIFIEAVLDTIPTAFGKPSP